LFFFFQAEDGIRDFHVTGVQTCALPICRQDRQPTRPGHARSRAALSSRSPDATSRPSGRRRRGSPVPVDRHDFITNCSCLTPGRSEEHTSELQSRENLVCRLLLEKKKKK